MLDIQRWKTYSREDLKAEGLSDREIKAISERQIGEFKPAFIGGRRRTEREGDQGGFYDRIQSLHQTVLTNREHR